MMASLPLPSSPRERGCAARAARAVSAISRRRCRRRYRRRGVEGRGAGLSLPYVTITVPSGTAIGKTVDAKIGATPPKVTQLNERDLFVITFRAHVFFDISR